MREDKQLAERADDTLSACMHGRFSSRFFSLAKLSELMSRLVNVAR